MQKHEKKLAEYARLLARVGLNIQPGQRAVVSCPVECAY
ncbi:MAG: aminopeptidase, partial [Oscillibacter sp.]|nr:aminopeptidase [Oscillibacter sp.]